MEYSLTFEKYQQGLREGKFLGLQCEACEQYTFPPQGVCGHCGGHKLQVAEMSDKGEIRTFTVVRVPPEGMKAPYIVAMVELENGTWAMGRLSNMDPDEADLNLIGRKVKLGSEPFELNAPEEAYHVLTFKVL